jgi:hypothetical protein
VCFDVKTERPDGSGFGGRFDKIAAVDVFHTLRSLTLKLIRLQHLLTVTACKRFCYN